MQDAGHNDYNFHFYSMNKSFYSSFFNEELRIFLDLQIILFPNNRNENVKVGIS